MSLLLAMAQSRADMPDDERRIEPTTAVWHLQRVKFNYRSMNVSYACDALGDKVAKILLAVGARKDIGVDVHCPFGTFASSASMLIKVATPIEATPANITALTTYSTETELAARLNNARLPTANDIERFPAEWRTVNLKRTRHLNLDEGDCELLQGLIEQVFPHLSVQVVKRRITCSLSGARRLRPTLQVAALMAAPTAQMAYAAEPQGTR